MFHEPQAGRAAEEAPTVLTCHAQNRSYFWAFRPSAYFANTAIDSTCAVWGNMLTTPADCSV